MFSRKNIDYNSVTMSSVGGISSLKKPVQIGSSKQPNTDFELLVVDRIKGLFIYTIDEDYM